MTTRHISITILLALLIGACAPAPTPAPTPDVAPIYTAAAQTVIAEISATAAAAVTPTALASPTEEGPTETPTLTATVVVGLATPGVIGTQLGLCDDAQWVVDITIPDGTQMTPGQDFLKTWKIRNTGACSWGAGYTVIYGGYNDKMNGTPAALTTTVTPGQEVEVSVQFKAPTKAGEYLSAWRMANASGSAFGQFFFVKIIVRQ